MEKYFKTKSKKLLGIGRSEVIGFDQIKKKAIIYITTKKSIEKK